MHGTNVKIYPHISHVIGHILTGLKMADSLFSCYVIQGQALLHLQVDERRLVNGMSRAILDRLSADCL